MSNFLNAPNITAAAVTVGALGSAYYAYQLYKESRPIKLPEEWRQIGTVTDMYVYPIKSCAPVVMNTAECTILGLRDGWLRDRVLMVIDEKNNFITARAYPELLLVHPSVKGSVLTLKHVDMEDLNVNLAEIVAINSTKQARVWGCPVNVFDCGYDACEWFSRHLARSPSKFRLAYYASQEPRAFKANKVFPRWLKTDTGAFADEMSFNIINQASVDDLQKRVGNIPISHRNFRPSFVVEGPAAYEEDNWKFIKIGDNVFEVVKPCTRCVLTTIDPETGVRNSGSEPLTTLKTYRQIEEPEQRTEWYLMLKVGQNYLIRRSNFKLCFM